ncbi:MAG: DUF4214 domain-containing protein [Myxococcaceae bacterium]
MKLTRIFQKVSRFFEKVAKQAEAANTAAARKTTAPSRRNDSSGFDVSTRGPVDLGRQPPASAASDAEFVTGLYRDLLGRAPDSGGFQAHLGGLSNGMSRDGIRNVFLTSPEYREKMSAPAPSEPAPSPTVSNRGLGPVPLEGYDSGKLNNPSHRTVKYVFGRVATHHSLAGVKDHAQAEALLRKMKPELEAEGLNIIDIKRDKILVQTELGHEWVDVVRGAGSGNPGWWWGSEGVGIPGTPKLPPGSHVPSPGNPSPTVPGNPGPAPTEPGAPLSTVPYRPEYSTANIDTSSTAAAGKSAAIWAKEKYPELFARASERQVTFEIMTHVIGALRAAGIDAHRVVNHPSHPIGNGNRYGTDAAVINGMVVDLYGSMGESNTPQALVHGPYEAGRLRE